MLIKYLYRVKSKITRQLKNIACRGFILLYSFENMYSLKIAILQLYILHIAPPHFIVTRQVLPVSAFW